jgi:hypothetical protein
MSAVLKAVATARSALASTLLIDWSPLRSSDLNVAVAGAFDSLLELGPSALAAVASGSMTAIRMMSAFIADLLLKAVPP